MKKLATVIFALSTSFGFSKQELNKKLDELFDLRIKIAKVQNEQFLKDAIAAGVSGAIIPDLLVDDAGPMVELCKRYDFALIQLVTPTTSEERALGIAETTTGFLYYVSVTGITGERTELPAVLTERLQWLKGQTDLPVCIGFGISQADQV